MGRPLAELLKTPFLDLDQIIETEEGAAITQIFSSKGEGYFRELEAQHLEKTTSTYSGFVLATGGGTPCFFENLDFMRTQGKVVFLDIEIADVVERFQKEGLEKRPLLKTYTTNSALQQYLQNTLDQRIFFYNKADFRIQISGKSPDELASEVVQHLEIKS